MLTIENQIEELIMTTKIQWTDETINPIVGCSKISAGCENCYAATAAKSARLQQFEQYKLVGNWDGTVQFVESQLLKPLSWKQPKMIFLFSMADPFHVNVPDEWIHRVMAMILLCPQHTFQILTKRSERMMNYFNQPNLWEVWTIIAENLLQIAEPKFRGTVNLNRHFSNRNMPKNLWLGVSVENQKAADSRIKHLRHTNATVRFLSCEPLLEPITLFDVDGTVSQSFIEFWPREMQYPADVIDWVIVGGESGAKARPCHLDWIRSIVKQCQSAEIPVFVKQLGSNAIDSVPYIDGVALAHHQIKTSDRKGSDISQFADINFRQFPV